MLVKMWCKGTNTHPLLVGVQTCIIIMEISMVVPQEDRNPAILGLGHIPKGQFILPPRYLFSHVHYCSPHNS